MLINYTRGPSWGDIEDPYDLARGALEGREGVFYLQELSNLGVLVRRPIRDGDFGEPAFIPWGSIHVITELPDVDETEEEQEEA